MALFATWLLSRLLQLFFLSRVCGLLRAKARLRMSQRLATVVAQLLVVPVVLKLVCVLLQCAG